MLAPMELSDVYGRYQFGARLSEDDLAWRKKIGSSLSLIPPTRQKKGGLTFHGHRRRSHASTADRTRH